MSEDCLTINVFRPSGLKSNAKLPVVSLIIVIRGHDLIPQLLCIQSYFGRKQTKWFNFTTSDGSFISRYGGGFQSGASLIYNASAIVAQSVIRVRKPVD